MFIRPASDVRWLPCPPHLRGTAQRPCALLSQEHILPSEVAVLIGILQGLHSQRPGSIGATPSGTTTFITTANRQRVMGLRFILDVSSEQVSNGALLRVQFTREDSSGIRHFAAHGNYWSPVLLVCLTIREQNWEDARQRLRTQLLKVILCHIPLLHIA